MAPAAHGMPSASLSHCGYGEWRGSLMVSGNSVCDSKHYLAGWEKEALKIQKDWLLPLLLSLAFLLHFASTEQKRFMTPVEESRSRHHGCISCSLGTFIVRWFVCLLGTFPSLILWSKCPDLLHVSCHQMSFSILQNNWFQSALLIFAAPSPWPYSQLCLGTSFSEFLSVNKFCVGFQEDFLILGIPCWRCSPQCCTSWKWSVYWWCFAQTSVGRYQGRWKSPSKSRLQRAEPVAGPGSKDFSVGYFVLSSFKQLREEQQMNGHFAHVWKIRVNLLFWV